MPMPIQHLVVGGPIHGYPNPHARNLGPACVSPALRCTCPQTGMAGRSTRTRPSPYLSAATPFRWTASIGTTHRDRSRLIRGWSSRTAPARTSARWRGRIWSSMRPACRRTRCMAHRRSGTSTYPVWQCFVLKREICEGGDFAPASPFHSRLAAMHLGDERPPAVPPGGSFWTVVY